MSFEYKCVEINEKNIWDEYLLNTTNPQILQSYAWGEVKKKYSWQPIRLGIYKEKELKGVILLLKKLIPFSGGRSIFYAPRGPIIDYDNPDILKNLIKGIKKLNNYHKAVLLKIDPFIYENNEKALYTLKECGFIKTQEQIQPRSTFIIDLERPCEEIIKSFEHKTRYNIKIAINKGVKVDIAEDEKGVSLFYELLKKTAQRNRFVIHEEEYYHTIWHLLHNNGGCSIFLASVNNEIVAGVFIFIFGEMCWYMYGASNDMFRNCMPNYLLHWEVIQWALKKGLKKYDLWGIPSNPTQDHPLWGVYRFKKGFNGEHVNLIGCYDLPISKLYYYIFQRGLVVYKKFVNLKTRGTLDSALEE
ncbi:MAG: peptidoglycan bridge formation glycyltransferase FemA/FemB family protein [Candidatus Firestonebacteria bacterium]|nr:peptidoglycan bridge formation glycyltransferase FemA/FemB family protein [Candidatus Firestonebacteria bacterium]